LFNQPFSGGDAIDAIRQSSDLQSSWHGAMVI
jgi:hypothetical protein